MLDTATSFAMAAVPSFQTLKLSKAPTTPKTMLHNPEKISGDGPEVRTREAAGEVNLPPSTSSRKPSFEIAAMLALWPRSDAPRRDRLAQVAENVDSPATTLPPNVLAGPPGSQFQARVKSVEYHRTCNRIICITVSMYSHHYLHI